MERSESSRGPRADARPGVLLLVRGRLTLDRAGPGAPRQELLREAEGLPVRLRAARQLRSRVRTGAGAVAAISVRLVRPRTAICRARRAPDDTALRVAPRGPVRDARDRPRVLLQRALSSPGAPVRAGVRGRRLAVPRGARPDSQHRGPAEGGARRRLGRRRGVLAPAGAIRLLLLVHPRREVRLRARPRVRRAVALPRRRARPAGGRRARRALEAPHGARGSRPGGADRRAG